MRARLPRARPEDTRRRLLSRRPTSAGLSDVQRPRLSGTARAGVWARASDKRCTPCWQRERRCSGRATWRGRRGAARRWMRASRRQRAAVRARRRGTARAASAAGARGHRDCAGCGARRGEAADERRGRIQSVVLRRAGAAKRGRAARARARAPADCAARSAMVDALPLIAMVRCSGQRSRRDRCVLAGSSKTPAMMRPVQQILSRVIARSRAALSAKAKTTLDLSRARHTVRSSVFSSLLFFPFPLSLPLPSVGLSLCPSSSNTTPYNTNGLLSGETILVGTTPSPSPPARAPRVVPRYRSPQNQALAIAAASLLRTTTRARQRRCAGRATVCASRRLRKGGRASRRVRQRRELRRSEESASARRARLWQTAAAALRRARGNA